MNSPNRREAPASLGFGRHALGRWREWMRRCADAAPTYSLAMLARRLCLAGVTDPVDVVLFDSQRARLHPRDNRCERRAVAGVLFWDRAERAALAEAIRAAEDRGFVFVDAGANVGLYTLWAKAAAAKAGIALTALAIEPDPINAARLRFNMKASGDEGVAIAAVALSDRAGTVRIAASDCANRGTVRLASAASADAVEVPASPLLDVVRASGLQRIDAMKVDIEGSEIAVLTRFLADAPPALLPSLLLIEVAQEESQLLDLLVRHGYRLDRQVGINGILSRPKRASGLAEVRLLPSAGRPDPDVSATESEDRNRPASASAM